MVNCEGKKVQKAQFVSKDTDIMITTSGCSCWVGNIDQRIIELCVSCKIAWFKPQAAYSGFIKDSNIN